MIKVSLFSDGEAGLTPNVPGMILCAVIFVLLQWKKTARMHPACWFLIAAGIGVVLQL
jgi:hypothetical protein